MNERREIHEGDFIAWEQGEGVFTVSGIGKVITLRDTEMGVIELRLQRDVKTRAIMEGAESLAGKRCRHELDAMQERADRRKAQEGILALS